MKFDEKIAATSSAFAERILRDFPEAESVAVILDFGRIEGSLLTGVWKVRDDEKTPNRLHGILKAMSNMFGLIIDRAVSAVRPKE